MADINALIEQAIAAPGVGRQKIDAVPATSQQKQAAITGSPSLSLAEDAFASTEGNKDKYAYRSLGQAAGDALSGVGLGFANSVLGIGALGTGIVSPDAGAWVTQRINDLNQFAQDKQSAGLFVRRRYANEQNAISEAEHQAQYQQDVQKDGEFLASLKRIGRDALSTTQNTLADPAVLSDVGASGVGSLLVGGPASKLIKGGVGAVAGRIAIGATGPSKAAFLIAKAAEKTSMPAAIAAMEAGGAYQSTVTDALDRGASNEDANKAGLVAAAIQAPFAAATGALVSKFEKSPFKVGSVGDAALNVGKETVEEGTQSATAQIAQNLGIRAAVDPKQDISAGVGSQIAQGALGGALSAGVVQAPGAAASATIETAKAAGRAAYESLGKPLLATESKITAAENAANDQKIVDGQNAAVGLVDVIRQDLADVSAAQPDFQPKLDKFLSTVTLDPAETVNQPPVVQKALEGATDRYDAMRRAAAAIDEPGRTEAEKLQLGKYILDTRTKYEQALREGFDTVAEAIPDKHPALAHFETFNKAFGDVSNHSGVRAAIMQLLGVVREDLSSQFDGQNLSTPEGQQQAQHTAEAVLSVAAQDPEAVHPNTLKTIRTHMEQGQINLTPEQLATLTAASEIIRATEARLSSMKALGLSRSDEVTHEIQTQNPVGDPEKTPVQSIRSKGRTIVKAVGSGDLEAARLQLADLRLFAEHLKNKVEAYNGNLASGNPYQHTGFKALDTGRKIGEAKWYDGKPVFLNPKSPTSIKFAQQAALDAKAAAELLNGLVSAYPQLGVQSIAPAPLSIDPSLNKSADEIIKERGNSTNKPADSQVNTANEQVSAQTSENSPESAKTETSATPVETNNEAKISPDNVETKAPEPAPKEAANQPSADQNQEKTAEPAAAGAPEKAPTQDTPSEVKTGVNGPPVVEVTTPETSVDPRNLLGSGDGKNMFVKAFRLLQRTGSRIINQGSTSVSFVLDQMRAKDAPKRLTKKILSVYEDLFHDEATRLETILNKNLQDYLLRKAERIKSGKAFSDPEGKVLNLTQEQDGKIVYNDELLQGAILAGLQWALDQGLRPSSRMSRDDVAKVLNIDEENLSDEVYEAFTQKIWATNGVKSLAQKIQSYWGVQANKGIGKGFTDGIPEAMAKEVLEALYKAQILKASQSRIGEKTFNFFAINKDRMDSILEGVRAYPSGIDQMVLESPDEELFIGSAPKKVAKSQLRNRIGRNTSQGQAAIKAAQDTPHKLNLAMVKFFASLSEEDALELFGENIPKGQKLNKNHQRSVDGLNNSVLGALKALENLVAQVNSHASAEGIDPKDVAVHYAYNLTKVGRLMMLGAYNPQSSKIVREAILPTRRTLDMNVLENNEAFMLAVAQAWGIKVHKQSWGKSIQQAVTLAHGKYAPVISILSDLQSGSLESLGKSDINVIKEAFGSDLSPVAIHAAMEFAKLANETNLSEFETDLYVEADGITDGPVNALFHLTIGAFTPKWLQKMAKGGLFTTPGMTANTFISAGGDNAVDLYEMTTQRLQTLLMQDLKNETDTKVQSLRWSMMQLMDMLVKDFSFDPKGKDGEELTLGRKIAKNPLTITVYGSGDAGIANKVAGEILDALYQEMSKAARGESNAEAELRQLLATLTSGKVVKNKKGGLFIAKESGSDLSSQSALDFTVDSATRKILANNIQRLFVDPMQVAIGGVMNETVAAREYLRDVVAIQSIIAEGEFNRLVQQRLEEKAKADPNFRKSDFLSQDELEEISREILKIVPPIRSGGQELHPSGSDNHTIDGVTLSQTLGGQLSTNAQVNGPSVAGVRGIPFTVISTGDGQMILNFYTQGQTPEGTLPVYDGLHMPLDKLKEHGEAINKAVHSAWMNNPLQGVNDSFQVFLSNLKPEMLQDPAVLKALDRLGITTVEDIHQLGKGLLKASLLAEARHRALARVKLSVDHMATAESPYVSEGEDLSQLSPEDQASRLNELAREEYEKILENNKALQESSDLLQQQQQLQERRAKPVKEETASGVRITRATGLPKLVRSLVLPAEQKNLLKEVTKFLANSSWEVIQGNEQQLIEHAKSVGDSFVESEPGGKVHGWANWESKRIYLATDKPETLLHELIHAAVTQRIIDHYLGNSLPEVASAISNLEVLMEEWKAQNENLGRMSPEQRRAYQNALWAVQREESNTERSEAENKAAALDEFLAWNLSNQELIRLAQQTQVQNVFARVIKTALQNLKNLILGRGNAASVPTNMYVAMRFNASLLMKGRATIQARHFNTIRQMATMPGSDSRLTDIQNKIGTKIFNLINDQPTPMDKLATEWLTSITQQHIQSVKDSFLQAGFAMNFQQQAVFTSVLTMMTTAARVDQAALARIQVLFDHVNKNLLPSDWADPQDQQAYYDAQQKVNALRGYDSVGRSIVEKDPLGRSTVLSAFLAAALVNDEFRDVLSRMSIPKSVKAPNDSLDNVLNNLFGEALDSLALNLSGEKKGTPSIQAAIDLLTDRLLQETENQENMVSQVVNPIGDLIDKGNDFAKDTLKKVTGKAIDKIEQLQSRTNNKLADTALEVAKVAAGIVNEDRAEAIMEGAVATSQRLKLWLPVQEAISDIVGRTESNAPVFDLIKQVRTMVQQVRQQFREHLPGILMSKFSREITKQEHADMFAGMAKTDLASLIVAFNPNEILDLLKSTRLQQREIQKLEDDIQREVGSNWTLIKQKSEQLAHFMNTGEVGSYLLRNATAVANLPQLTNSPVQVNDRLIGRIDRLTTLYALRGLHPQVKTTLNNLATMEPKGLKFMLTYLVGQRKAEQDKVQSPEAVINHYKGYIPSDPRAGAHMIVAKDSEGVRLKLRGYIRVGDYQNSSNEVIPESRGYYFSPVGVRAIFKQGIMQNIRPTASGVDPATGFTHDGLMTAGQILDPADVARIRRRRGRSETGQPLMPIFDVYGEVVGYERSVDPLQESHLERSTNLAQMIGVWRGRQVEESLAGQFNDQLIGALKNIWEQGKKDGQQDRFVDLLDPNLGDPVIADAIRLFTPETFRMIRDVFGAEGFMVRKDMINDAVGYRAPSIGDAWTGNTRLPPKVAETARKIAIGVFGTQAYKYLTVAEKFTQNVVSEARQIIVVKSVVVPVTNFISNIYQLASRGVSLQRITRDMPKKLSEVSAYVKFRQRQIELEADERAASHDVVELRKIRAELQTTRDAIKRMSIWPLIEAGEFASISDAGSLQKEETSLYEGRLNDYIEEKVNRLPKGVRTLGRYAWISKDTALFQGLRRAMDYGDFLAKAIRYDHLIQDKKLSSEKALASISEEFVNYDRLPGRFREGLENMGLLWFWSYKVRIAKVAAATIRENPLHAFLTSLVPTPDFIGSIGTPLEDNILSMGLDGSLKWPVGPGMGFRSIEMNPWVNLSGVL